MAGRKSARVITRKWPCGTCGLQCNDDSVFCEGCGVWHHAKCERLSAKDLSTLNRLPDDYLCSSCANDVGGGYDFAGALRRLENASNLGMLETTVKMEQILLRKTPLAQVKAEEIRFGKHTVDVAAQEILTRVGKSHHLFFISLSTWAWKLGRPKIIYRYRTRYHFFKKWCLREQFILEYTFSYRPDYFVFFFKLFVLYCCVSFKTISLDFLFFVLPKIVLS